MKDRTQNCRGASTIEYALICSVMFIACCAALGPIGDTASSLLFSVGQNIELAGGGSVSSNSPVGQTHGPHGNGGASSPATESASQPLDTMGTPP